MSVDVQAVCSHQVLLSTRIPVSSKCATGAVRIAAMAWFSDLSSSVAIGVGTSATQPV
ncbi:hypothetical protein GCM10009754_85580 [Amycolatopsis minnesotensis]|uniref:Uncharacterized protein n=1 Tax=Amycolatopsis minnesotensis TaxID=337894 RepID=A0ABP5E9M7_9PSEU